ncbi:MAG: hypothetical protein ACOCRL_02180 [Bacillota bacterium]
MKDRFTAGFIAGSLAGIISSSVNFLLMLFNFGTLRYIDFAGILIYGRKPLNFQEDLFAYIGFIIFSGLLAELFVYLIKFTGNSYYWFKSALFGTGSWFFIYAVSLLFKMPFLRRISFNSSINNFISSLVYGLLIGYIVLKIERKFHV